MPRISAAIQTLHAYRMQLAVCVLSCCGLLNTHAADTASLYQALPFGLLLKASTFYEPGEIKEACVFADTAIRLDTGPKLKWGSAEIFILFQAGQESFNESRQIT